MICLIAAAAAALCAARISCICGMLCFSSICDESATSDTTRKLYRLLLFLRIVIVFLCITHVHTHVLARIEITYFADDEQSAAIFSDPFPRVCVELRMIE